MGKTGGKLSSTFWSWVAAVVVAAAATVVAALAGARNLALIAAAGLAVGALGLAWSFVATLKQATRRQSRGSERD